MYKVYIIGVGPGSIDYLLPIAKHEIERCDVLIGASRLLMLFNNLKKEVIPIKGDVDTSIISEIKHRRKHKRIGILVSGDTGVYSLLGKLSKIFTSDEYVVIPGISSISVAAARVGQMWHEFKIISVHGRSIDILVECIKKEPKVAVFTDKEHTPEIIAKYLLDKGITHRDIIVFENLTYPDERIIKTDIVCLSKMKGFSGLCLMFIMMKP
jgi:cobalt-precorrin-7 (C5)-methyltransferase